MEKKERMHAYVRMSSKSQEVVLQDVPIPEIAEEEVLVKMEAFGVGVHDRYFIPSHAPFPYVIGSEGSGTVIEVGKNVQKRKVGDRVIVSSTLLEKGGSWAEYVAVPEERVFLLPDQLTFEEGAALPIAGKTAMECFSSLQLKKGDSLFLAGASGAIGTLLIRLAHSSGVHVSGSASLKNQGYMHELGAEKTVDYKNPRWKEQVKNWMPKGVDAAVAIQPMTVEDSMDVVKEGGLLITLSGADISPQRNVSVQQVGHHLDMKKTMNALFEKIIDKKIKLEIEQVYPFEEVIEALEKTETRHARGKSVVLVNS